MILRRPYWLDVSVDRGASKGGEGVLVRKRLGRWGEGRSALFLFLAHLLCTPLRKAMAVRRRIGRSVRVYCCPVEERRNVLASDDFPPPLHSDSVDERGVE